MKAPLVPGSAGHRDTKRAGRGVTRRVAGDLYLIGPPRGRRRARPAQGRAAGVPGTPCQGHAAATGRAGG